MFWTGTCSCGGVGLRAKTAPPMRFLCHCTICQGVYRQPYADVTALWTWNVSVERGADEIVYQRHSWLPASVRRGTCAHCRQPVLGHLQMPPSGVAFVPTAIWGQRDLPAPVGHIFYHSRQHDIDDDLPKVSGLWASELQMTAWMLGRLVGPPRRGRT